MAVSTSPIQCTVLFHDSDRTVLVRDGNGRPYWLRRRSHTVPWLQYGGPVLSHEVWEPSTDRFPDDEARHLITKTAEDLEIPPTTRRHLSGGCPPVWGRLYTRDSEHVDPERSMHRDIQHAQAQGGRVRRLIHAAFPYTRDTENVLRERAGRIYTETKWMTYFRPSMRETA